MNGHPTGATIELDNLGRTYGEGPTAVHALKGASLNIPAIFAPLVNRFERPRERDPSSAGRARPIAGMVLACVGFAGVALVGVSVTPDLSWVALALPTAAMLVAGALGTRRTT